MKYNKNIILSALLAATSVTPAAAQIETGQDSLVNVAFRKVAKDDVLGGVSSINYRELMEVLNEHMQTLSLLQPKIYEAVIGKIRALRR